MSKAPTVVRTFDSAVFAHLARGRLESEGIESFIVDEHQVTNNPLTAIAVGGIKLVVAEDDLHAARELLDQRIEVSDTCAACGSTNIERNARGRRLAFLTLMFAHIPIGRAKTKLRCDDCDHAWRE